MRLSHLTLGAADSEGAALLVVRAALASDPQRVKPIAVRDAQQPPGE